MMTNLATAFRINTLRQHLGLSPLVDKLRRMMIGFKKLKDYLALPREPQPWIIKPLIPVGGLVNMYGKPKTGKSFVAMGMAQAIVNGDETWEGFEIHKYGPVAYIQVDTPREEWAKRAEVVQQLCQSDDVEFWIADMWCMPQYPVDILDPNSTIITWLKEELDKVKPILVIIDTIREVHSGDEDSSTVMRNVISKIVGACMPSEGAERPIPAILFLSHARKDNAWAMGDEDMMDQARGSSYVNGRMDSIIHITPKTLKFKGRATGEQRKQLWKDDQGWVHVVQEDDGSNDMIRDIMMEKPGLSVNAMAKILMGELKCSLSTATRRIHEYQHKHGKKGE